LGMGLASADHGVALDAAFYAAHHVLVKGTLFLTIGVAAVTNGRRLRLVMFLALILALSLSGLPLTGGALAKLAVKAPLGNGAAGTLAAISAAGTTLLMLHFVMRLAKGAPQDAQAAPPAGSIWWPWLAMALASVFVPWLIYPALGQDIADALTLAAIWEALWPVLIGAVLAARLWRWGHRLPRVPEGDIIIAGEAAFRASAGLGALFERLDLRLRQWPAAGLSLLLIALILAAAAGAGQ
jgi:formate hydrogenlyase subunit 3/multisubunit Na+/H+ antiporter MnhD subunit